MNLLSDGILFDLLLARGVPGKIRQVMHAFSSDWSDSINGLERIFIQADTKLTPVRAVCR